MPDPSSLLYIAGTFDSGLGVKEGVIESIKFFTHEKTWSLPWQRFWQDAIHEASRPKRWRITAAAIHEDGIEPPTNPV